MLLRQKVRQKLRSKMSINGEQVWNDVPFNISAGKLRNERQDTFRGTQHMIMEQRVY